MIATYMICGLSNLGAIGVAIGALTSLNLTFLGPRHITHCLPPSHCPVPLSLTQALTHVIVACQERPGVIATKMIYGLNILRVISVAIGTLTYLAPSRTAHSPSPSFFPTVRPSSLAHSLFSLPGSVRRDSHLHGLQAEQLGGYR